MCTWLTRLRDWYASWTHQKKWRAVGWHHEQHYNTEKQCQASWTWHQKTWHHELLYNTLRGELLVVVLWHLETVKIFVLCCDYWWTNFVRPRLWIVKEKKHHPILQNIPVALMEVFTYNLLFQYKDENNRIISLEFCKVWWLLHACHLVKIWWRKWYP